MNYHNPDNLSDWGQSDGWRLLTTEEIKQPLPEDAEFWSKYSGWNVSAQRGEVSESNVTYRTRKPSASPLIAQLDAEIKAKQELREIALAVEAGAEWEYEKPVGQWEKTAAPFAEVVKQGWNVRLKPKPVTRPCVEDEVISLIQKRRDAGLAKYGVSMDRKDLTLSQWAQHAIEEALDLAIYLTKFKQEHEEKPCTTEEAK